jgi:hypothetical protein
LKIREEFLGAGHPECMATRHNIWELYNVQGMHEEAKKYSDRNIEEMEKRSK